MSRAHMEAYAHAMMERHTRWALWARHVQQHAMVAQYPNATNRMARLQIILATASAVPTHPAATGGARILLLAPPMVACARAQMDLSTKLETTRTTAKAWLVKVAFLAPAAASLQVLVLLVIR